jgi:hypothetical protein
LSKSTRGDAVRGAGLRGAKAGRRADSQLGFDRQSKNGCRGEGARSRRAEAKGLLHDLAAEVNKWAGVAPEIFMPAGNIGEQILAYIDEDPSVMVLVVGASPPTEESFSVIAFLTGRLVGNHSIPLVIVPGNLSDKQTVNMT